MHQNLLSKSQLDKLQKVFSTKKKLSAANDEMENILSEVLAECDKEKFGKMQSPINIISSFECGHTQIMKEAEFTKNPLQFSYPPFVYNCSIMNNGHTVQVNIDPMNKCLVSIHGKEYKLAQFHFHTPSEHMIDSKQYDMEMHLVHVNEKNEIAVLGFIFSKREQYQRPKLELTQSRAHLVLSKMLINTEISMQPVNEDETDVDTDDDWQDDSDKSAKASKKKKAPKKPNDFLDQFWDQLPAKKTSKDIPLATPISFDYLFETSSNNFVKCIETKRDQYRHGDLRISGLTDNTAIHRGCPVDGVEEGPLYEPTAIEEAELMLEQHEQCERLPGLLRPNCQIEIAEQLTRGLVTCLHTVSFSF